MAAVDDAGSAASADTFTMTSSTEDDISYISSSSTSSSLENDIDELELQLESYVETIDACIQLLQELKHKVGTYSVHHNNTVTPLTELIHAWSIEFSTVGLNETNQTWGAYLFDKLQTCHEVK